jgi:hypothetical protein
MHRLLNLVTDVSSRLSWAPLFWPFAFFVPFFLLFWLRRDRSRLPGPIANWIAVGSACLVLAAFIAADAFYCLSSAFWDHNEPGVGIQSWLFWRGEAIYQDLLTEQRYSGPYGPYAYIAVGLCQGLIGPGVFGTKLLPCIAGAVAIGLFYVVLRRRTSVRLALIFTSLLAALSLRLGPFAFWTRPEPFLVLCVTAGLIAATRKGLVNTVLLGVTLGIAIDLKINSMCYFLPVVVLAVETGFGWRELAKAAAIAAAVTILPFLVFPQISLSNYLGILQLIGKRGFGFLEFHLSLEWLVTLLVPAAGGLLFYRLTSSTRSAGPTGDQKWFLAAIVVASVALLLSASRLGAGPHHFLPLIPIVLFFAAEQTAKGRSVQSHSGMLAGTGYALCFSWLLSCVLVALGSAYSISAAAIRQESEAAASIRDLQQLVDEHPAYTWLGGASLNGVPVQSPYHLHLVFKGMPPGLHPPAQMDFQLAGNPETDVTKLEQEIRGRYRRPVAWVVPKGSLPFGMKTAFDQSRPLFSEKFQREFAERFVKAGSSRFFDFYLPR